MTAAALAAHVHRWEPGDPGRPTLLLLHGTGGTEDDLIPLGRMLDPEAPLLAPRGNVLENGMPRFFRRLAEGVFDGPDLIARAGALADWLAAAAAHYGFDPGRVVAAGYSNGANAAAAMLLLRPAALSGAVLFRAMLPIVPDTPPDLAGKRVLIAAGLHDPYSRTAQALAERLEGYGADVTLDWRDAGHGLERADVERAREWLLAGRAAPVRG